jgi:non-specific serine/threonine protein kinase
LRWASDRGAVEIELRLASALTLFWNARGYLSEGRGRLACGLQHGQAAPARVRAKALAWASFLAVVQGEVDSARQHLEEAVLLTRGVEVPLPLGLLLLTVRAWHAHGVGQHEAALEALEEAMALMQRSGLKPTGGLRWLYGTTLLWLDRIDDSARVHEATLAEARASGDASTLGVVLADLGTIALIRGDPRNATDQLRQALVLASQLGDVLLPVLCLESLAAAAEALGQHRDVALLLGAAEALCTRIGIPLPGAPRTTDEMRRPLPARLKPAHLIAAARAALGEALFASAREAGRQLTVEQVLDEVLGSSAIVELKPTLVPLRGARHRS